MAKLPKELSDVLAGGHNVWVATVDAEGMPNVSIKGSGALLDDEHLLFADMFSRKTRDNIAHNGRVAVGIHDPDTKVALQVKGHAELIDSGPVFDRVNERLATLSQAAHLPPMKYVVRISVESVWNMGPGPDAGKQIAQRLAPQMSSGWSRVRNRPDPRGRLGALRSGAPSCGDRGPRGGTAACARDRRPLDQRRAHDRPRAPAPGTPAPRADRGRGGRVDVAREVAAIGSPRRGERHIVVLARPEGSEHALPTFVIEGVGELVEALRAA